MSGTPISRRSTRACWRASRSRQSSASGSTRLVVTGSRWSAAGRYLPSLLRASVVTIVLSCLSMGLAVALGVLIASGRVYGSRPVRVALTGYVELMRGTPVLLQLFVLYYGIAAAVRLPAFAAALLGLALNYAAYESEIYRGALEAVPVGQLEAARTLGLSESQVLTAHPRSAGVPARAGADDERLRRAAQGFVARLGADRDGADQADADLRDESRKLGRFPGSLCAALYLAMSLPLSALARRLEQRWKAPTHDRRRRRFRARRAAAQAEAGPCSRT